MAKRKHTPQEIINKLREAEVVIAAGRTVAEASRRIGVTGGGGSASTSHPRPSSWSICACSRCCQQHSRSVTQVLIPSQTWRRYALIGGTAPRPTRSAYSNVPDT